MRIIGTGIDIIEIERIRKVSQRNPAFLKRVFSKEELGYALKSKKKWERLAVRFAAKEAVWKALRGRQQVALRGISVSRAANGEPWVNLKTLGLPKGWKASLSLSHNDTHAVAHCLVYAE
ncbi:MAG: holo-ACP synthase [Elusimicrobiota bacterium]